MVWLIDVAGGEVLDRGQTVVQIEGPAAVGVQMQCTVFGQFGNGGRVGCCRAPGAEGGRGVCSCGVVGQGRCHPDG